MTKTSAPKFRAGKKVAATTRRGTHIGRVIGVDQRANGPWVRVNLAAPRKAPDVRSFRPANLQLA
jgi:hypothetical protein